MSLSLGPGSLLVLNATAMDARCKVEAVGMESAVDCRVNGPPKAKCTVPRGSGAAGAAQRDNPAPALPQIFLFPAQAELLLQFHSPPNRRRYVIARWDQGEVSAHGPRYELGIGKGN